MKSLRAGLVAAALAALTAAGLVATSAPAWATTVDQRISPVDAIRDALLDPGNFTDYIVGDINNDGAYDTQEPGFGTAPAWMNAIAAKTGGTPAQVDEGTKYVTKACKTGFGCISALAGLGLALIGIGAVEEWGEDPFVMPWQQTDEGVNPDVTSLPVNYYPSMVPNPTPCIADFRIDQLYTQDPAIPAMQILAVAPVGGFCTVGNVNAAADFRSLVTGEIRHVNFNNGGMWARSEFPWRQFESQTQYNPAAYGETWQQTKLVRYHHDQTATGGSAAYTAKGAWWGLNPVPGSGQIESLTRCQRPNGTTYDVVTVENINSGLAAIPPCEDGDTAVYTQTTIVNPDGSRELQTSQRLDGGTIGNEQFPLCVTNGCKLLVKADGVPCQVGMAACVDWARDKSDNTCWYGPYQMPLRLCDPLERAYQSGTTVPATKKNTDGDPLTWDGPEPQLQPTSSPSASATTTTTTQPSPTTTGTADPNPTTSTNPSASPSPSSTTSTGTGTGTNPFTGSEGSPGPSDPAGQDCFPTGWGVFNPVGWVLQPIRCAFEPDPQLTRARVETVKTTLGASGPGPVIVAVVNVADAVPAGGGCSGPAVSFDLSGVHQTLHPFSACTEPMSTAATYSKALASLVIVIGGGLAIVRAVGSGFGWSFGMRGGGPDAP